MAEIRRGTGAERGRDRRTEERSISAYVDGTAVRQLQTVPKRRHPEGVRPSVSTATRKNRERALQMNLGYVLFLTAAAVVTVFTCVNYLQLQAQGTNLQKQVTALETQLDAAILRNDSDYNRIMANVDMEHIKDVAINELGMDYVQKSQIVTYQLEDTGYVRQYSEVPEE